MNDAIDQRIKAWLDGELAGEDARRVEAFVATNASAREVVRDLEAISRAIGETPMAVPATDDERLWDLIQRRRDRVEIATLTRRLSSLAAACVLLASTVAWLAGTGGGESHEVLDGRAGPKGDRGPSLDSFLDSGSGGSNDGGSRGGSEAVEPPGAGDSSTE